MIRHDDDSNLSSGTCYTLYLEYLGGLVPLLKGKRTSKIRPEFVIFDPQIDNSSVFLQFSPDSKSSSGSSQSTTGINGRTDSSDSDYDDRCRGSPNTPRKRKCRSKRRHHSNNNDKANNTETEITDELAYVDTLPEEVKLVEVTSNIWGTKFKIHGLAKTVPANLGQVTYKTSLLHLQPRQMTLVITELRDDFPTGPDPNFNPNLFSEDEEDQIFHNNEQKLNNLAQRRLTENSPPIAPMSPRPNRFTVRNKNTTINGCRTIEHGISPLAKQESYEDESPTGNETSAEITTTNNNKPIRPKNIETPITNPRPGPSYTSLVTQYSKSSSNSSGGQSRHAISPLCCEGSVPTLQSPKNAVAPSDIIFDRPPAGQTTLMSYSSNNDYSSNMVQVKNALLPEQNNRNTNAHVNPVPLNLNLNLERIDSKARDKIHQVVSKKKEMMYIDEENQSPASTTTVVSTNFNNNGDIKMKRTPTIVSIAPALPDSITRSCSVGYLDSVEITPSDEALLMLRKDAPHKRLVLVDKKPHKKRKYRQEDFRKPKLQQSGKSKSLDSCDILSSSLSHGLTTKTIDKTTVTASKLKNISENSDKNFKCSPCSKNSDLENELKKITTTITSVSTTTTTTTQLLDCNVNNYNHRLPATTKLLRNKNNNLFDPTTSGSSTIAATLNNKSDPRKKTEVITSYTDSPLFSRKHRFGSKNSNGYASLNNNNNININNFNNNHNNGMSSSSNQILNEINDNRSPLLGRKSNESSFNLVKQLSEVRRKRKEAQHQNLHYHQNSIEEISSSTSNNTTIEATPVESKTSVSLHTQVHTTFCLFKCSRTRTRCNSI